MELYTDLTDWYHLLDPVDDHADEVEAMLAAFGRALELSSRPSLLELGAGAGNNARFLAPHFALTLNDLSERMLDLSRAQNPGAVHVAGDMRTLRLRRTFDAVLVHDAVCYMATRDDLRAAAQTAYEHLRHGGVALFIPDTVRDVFVEGGDDGEVRDGTRWMRFMEHSWDPDPTDDSYTVDYVFLLRDEHGVRVVHDRQTEGLFSIATWTEILEEVGFTVERVERPLPEDEDDRGFFAEMFLCRREN